MLTLVLSSCSYFSVLIDVFSTILCVSLFLYSFSTEIISYVGLSTRFSVCVYLFVSSFVGTSSTSVCTFFGDENFSSLSSSISVSECVVDFCQKSDDISFFFCVSVRFKKLSKSSFADLIFLRTCFVNFKVA